jgi:hypothetical protein
VSNNLQVSLAITKGNTCHEMKKVSALVEGFRKIWKTQGQSLVKEITPKQVWIG